MYMKQSQTHSVFRYTAVFEPAEEGGFVVTVPKLPGLVTEGDTFEQAMDMVQDAITGYLSVLDENGEKPPEPDITSFTAPIDVSFTSRFFPIA